ncbi:putative oligosaccharyltransferase complex subunit epsilon [Blattamonas nauphoetae]|uniref:Dolichyl-diphosphooligosaccharide--protein glycosyltransferase subunit OST2 n=1 Tax=Blattamonas nauphoetae TaxID=2049346 RepID=A0ABQ9XVV3_9EUKA|nr:putative oligosaccharyltransferase complex subunit epsilon [Blattamonas nauphoetae]KAK2957116.1 putative oligosaccharyltransferase complex subunit epsilon [Blattamonas nauphoetae]
MDTSKGIWNRYRTSTPGLIQTLDLFIVFCGVMVVAVFGYGLVFTTQPFNAFISAIFATAGPLFFTISLRMQILNPKEFNNMSPEWAFLSYLACIGLLFFVISSFLG